MPRVAKLKPVRDPKSGKYYISIPPAMSETGKRQRLYFDSERKASAEAKRRNTNLKQHGFKSASLPADLATEAARCVKMLEPWGATLSEAVKAFIDLRETQEKSVSVFDAWTAFIASKDNHSDRYMQQLNYAFSKLPAKFESRMICDMDRDAIREACEAVGDMPTSFNNARTLWHGLLVFSLKEGWVRKNPVKEFDRKRKDSKPPCILTINQASKLLKNAESCEAPAVALLLFAGIRPDELKRLEWTDVDLSSRNLRVPDKKSKTVVGRNVHLEDVAIEWLKRTKERSGPIVPANWKRRISRIRKSTGLTGDDQDICRHTYGSMWLNAFEDQAALQTHMGHTHVNTYLRHYHRAVAKKVAISYWKLTPAFVMRENEGTKRNEDAIKAVSAA